MGDGDVKWHDNKFEKQPERQRDTIESVQFVRRDKFILVWRHRLSCTRKFGHNEWDSWLKAKKNLLPVYRQKTSSQSTGDHEQQLPVNAVHVYTALVVVTFSR